VLGNVVSSASRSWCSAVIVGIGSGFFGSSSAHWKAASPDIGRR
jgi:type IV secretory pathway TrbL component